MTAAELRERAINLLAPPYGGVPSDLDITRADAWAKLAISAAISETGTTPAADQDDAPEAIRYTADVVATTPDGRLLLIERGWPPYQGHLALPGGHVDAGETSRAAAARELLEETGIQVDPADLAMVGVYDAPGRDPRGRYVSVAYTVTVPDDTEARAGDDATAACWVPLATTGGHLAFDHARIIADARRQGGLR